MKPARPAIDWAQVHRRLARTAEAAGAALRLSPERAREVMDERARALARVPPTADRAAEVLEIAVFSLETERYGIETRYLREVIRVTDCARLPGAPLFVLGVVNVRGEVLLLIDLRAFFGLPARNATANLTRVLVLGDGRAEFGAPADAAEQITTLRVDEIHDPPESASSAARAYLRGVTADALIVLDGAALLRDGRLFIDQADEGGA